MTREEATREILFRGRQLNGTEWFEGDLSHVIHDGGRCYVFPADGYNSPDWYEVNPTTVGQYTGLTDKNGVKIFKGDIVRISVPIYKWQTIEDISEVYFDSGCYCVNWGGNYRPHDRTRIDSFIPDTKFEVIGNVHDNPELLEGGQGE